VYCVCVCVCERERDPSNKSLDFHQTQLRYFIKKITSCFRLEDHHQAIITKIFKIRCNAVQIKLVIWDPI